MRKGQRGNDRVFNLTSSRSESLRGNGATRAGESPATHGFALLGKQLQSTVRASCTQRENVGGGEIWGSVRVGGVCG